MLFARAQGLMSGTHFALRHFRSKLVLLAVSLGLLVTTSETSQAQTYGVLYNFCSQPNCADGAIATSAQVQDKNGNLYGTTIEGGTGPCDSYHGGCGTVFELSPAGAYTVLYSFTGNPDGEDPSGLVFDKNGNLYGTGLGGVYNHGTVFEITSSGTEKVLYSFTGGADGAWPQGPLVLDAQGNLYGTTEAGGLENGCGGYGCGTVFELSPNGTETILYAFTGGVDDGNPSGGVLRDAQGNLYGMTAKFENNKVYPGTIFELTPSGVETQLYSFLGAGDGWGPFGGLVRDADGNLYGTTLYGGLPSCYSASQNGCGVVFRVTPSGKERVRHKFTGKEDGGSPTSGLVQDAQGNLYGTTPFGGDRSCLYGAGCGVVFEIPKKGKEIVLHTFTGGGEGAAPDALLRDAEGNLYGTAGGGAYGGGVVFKVTP
jgi:uncharacterized repeat protein (TIGR03803 family)